MSLYLGKTQIENISVSFTTSKDGESSESIQLQSKTVTPKENQQIVTPDSGYGGLSSVTVSAIPSNYIGSGVTTQNYYIGDSEPTSSVGSDGDLYFVRG